MKKSVSLFVIIFSAFACNSEQPNLKSDLQIANLKGNVWKIDKTIHNASGNCVCPAAMKTECNESEYVYDKKGNLLLSCTVDENGSINDSSKYVYNRHGVCSEIVKFSGRKLVGKEVPVFQAEKMTGVKICNENGLTETTLNFVYSGQATG